MTERERDIGKGSDLLGISEEEQVGETRGTERQENAIDGLRSGVPGEKEAHCVRRGINPYLRWPSSDHSTL